VPLQIYRMRERADKLCSSAKWSEEGKISWDEEEKGIGLEETACRECVTVVLREECKEKCTESDSRECSKSQARGSIGESKFRNNTRREVV